MPAPRCVVAAVRRATRRRSARRWLASGLMALTVTSAAHAAGPPACHADDRPASVTPAGDGRWTVLDTVFGLPEAFRPDDLVSAREAGFDDDRSLRAVVIPDLRALLAAAEADGVAFELQSAFRDYAYQARTFAHWVEVDGYDKALATSARAGHSEHQLGTVIDLRSAGGPAPWNVDDWATTPEGAWIAANGWRYGFVLSYPQGAQDRSCYAYEPWHWRWLGRETAARIRARGVVPREALWEVRGDD